MPVAAGQRRVCVQQQRAVRFGVEIAELLRGRGPIGCSFGVAEGGSHFRQREEEHLHAGEVVVAVGLEERAARVVEDLRRAGERQPQQAVGAGLEQRAQADADLAAERIGAVAQEGARRRCDASADRRGARSRRPSWARGCIGPSRRAVGRRGSSRPAPRRRGRRRSPGRTCERPAAGSRGNRGSTRLRRSRRRSGRRCRSSGC